jgi:hypothetical protein
MPWPLRNSNTFGILDNKKSLVFLALLAELRCTLFRVPEELVGQWRFWNAGE